MPGPRRERGDTSPAGLTSGPTDALRTVLPRRQAVLLLLVLALAAGGVALASVLVKPSNARSFTLFHGSVLLADKNAPVSVNLADGKPTTRLIDANKQVSASSESDVDTVALDNSTLLLDRSTGEFNLVDSTGFVVKTSAGGVPLSAAKNVTGAIGVAAGTSAFIVQSAPTSTAVYLVGANTVQSAQSATATVKPRAFASLDEGSTSSSPGLAVQANGALWLLTGTSGSQTLHQLSVPSNSEAGVELTDHDRATVDALAAVGVATHNADGSGGDVVALASPRTLQVFQPDGTSRSVAVAGLDGVTAILPATNAQGQLAFLYKTSTGWQLVTVGADGAASAGARQLDKIAASATLADPAMSNGMLYTMEHGDDAHLWAISLSGAVTPLEGRADYPTQKSSTGAQAEAGTFADGVVFARGDRVIFNSPQHALAVAAFTDGSHPPVIVDKSTAIDLNAAGGAAALKGLQTPTAKPQQPNPTQAPTPVTPPAQNVDNQVNCATTDQVPHIPAITSAVTAARSVIVSWTYPLLDPRDCVPSTYVVSIKLLSSDAPSPPGQVTVQGQQAVNITGLFPQTQYEITVSAFINGHGTASAPVDVTTGREGPAAPTGVHTNTDGNGNWTITWQSCGNAASGCVESASWNVIPHFCDGSGVSSPPPAITVAGDPTLTSFTATMHADDTDLGRGLSFDVQGVGKLGDVGTSAGDKACSYSWQSPIASAFSLSASTPPVAAYGGVTSSTVTLSIVGDAVQAGGGIGAQYVYELINGSKIEKQGPTSATTATFSDLIVGTNYQAAVLISPPRHPETAVQVGPIPVATASESWPALSLTATFVPTDAFNGTLTLSIAGISSAAVGGETFDLRNSSLSCASTQLPLSRNGIDPSVPSQFTVNRLIYSGSCTVRVGLVESSSGVLGGTPYPSPLTANVSIGQPGYTQSQNDFSAAFAPAADANGRSDVTISDTAGNNGFILDTGWSYSVSDGDTADGNCVQDASTSAPPTSVSIKASCVDNKGDATGWTITIKFSYLGQGHTYTVAISGKPPTYVAPPPPNH